jgi:Zn finger protein HypA/HybF involved in hydrogenase expression
LKKKTTEVFISEAFSLQGPKYDYSRVVYSGAHNKVEIFCRACKKYFLQSPRKHLNGQGCPACNGTPKRTTSAFVAELVSVHGDTYDYKDSEYYGIHEQFTFWCNSHGFVSMLASNHLKGAKCAKCAGNWKKDSETFVEESKELHGPIYDYGKVSYTDSHSPVEIICPKHSSFWQAPTTHLGGAGCPKCASYGFNTEIAAHFYVLSDSVQTTKVGITNRDIDSRIKEISKSSLRSYRMIDSFYFKSGQSALNMETILLRELRSTHKQPTEKFDGSTECFYDVDIQALLNRIEELIEEHSYAPNRLVDTYREAAL